MGASPVRRERGRTLINHAPDQLVWALLARESKVDPKRPSADGAKVDHQLRDLRGFALDIGGRIAREVPEANVSAFKRRRVRLPDGTFGYRVIRPEWEALLTALRRGAFNALAVVDIDRATRDPRILEDLIDVVELYGVYVVSMTGNIDLSSDAGISNARSLVNQRNAESRNASRRTTDGKRDAAHLGKNSGGPYRPFGWKKNRLGINKREEKHIKREIKRIVDGGVNATTIAQEWNTRKIPTVQGGMWHASTIRAMFTGPRMCGKVVYRGEVLIGEDGQPVRGQWEPILTDDEHDAIVRALGPTPSSERSRLGGKGTGYATRHLLSPFLRCGKCNARMIGSWRKKASGERREIYKCPSKGQGGCAGIARDAAPINAYITALVIADHQRIDAEKVEELPPWPKTQELAALAERIDESTRRYENGEVSAERYFPSLARMEASLAELRRERSRYAKREDARRASFGNIAEEWGKPDFTIEMKQAAVGKTLSAVIVLAAGAGTHFHPDQLKPVFQTEE